MAYYDEQSHWRTDIADPRKDSGELSEVGFNRLQGRVCVDSMHVNHPDISGLISDSVSVSHASRKRGNSYITLSNHALSSLCAPRSLHPVRKGGVSINTMFSTTCTSLSAALVSSHRIAGIFPVHRRWSLLTLIKSLLVASLTN